MGYPILGAAAACADGAALSVYFRFLNSLGGGVPDTAVSGRVIVYSLSSASISGGGRVFGCGRRNERGKLLNLCRV